MKKFAFLILLVLVLLTGCVTGSIPVENQPPIAYIDSISPTEILIGETMTFNGHGTDLDGTVVAYRWRSSIDDDLSTRASFQTSSLSEGQHTIYFKVQDNNGAWSEEVRNTVAVSGVAAGAPVINSFDADPWSITFGGSSTLSWDVSGAATIVIDQGIGSVVSIGTRVVYPDTTTTYVLTATNAAGSAMGTIQVTVSGTQPGGLPTVNLFTANPLVIPGGASTTLSWDVSNAASVDITPGVGSVPNIGSILVSPGTTMNYTLTATNAAGWRTITITVVVTAAGVPDLVVSSLAHSPASPTTTDTVNFMAMVTNAGTGTAGVSTLSFQIGGESPQTYNVPALAPGAMHPV